MKLDKGTTFCFISRISDDLQVEEALRFSTGLLEKAGLKRVESGADVSISLTPCSGMGTGAFRIDINKADKLIDVNAGDAEGSRCGIYELLEILGIRWFSPDEEPIVPDLPLVLSDKIFTGKIITPSFPYRGLHICAGKYHYDERVAQWMSFNKMNRKLTHLDEEEFIGKDLECLGLKMDTTVHSYSLMIPDELFEKHPEWFALLGGKRIKQKNGGQLCLSNKEMRRKFAENIIAYHEKFPQIATIGICPNDGYGWCECEECLKLDTSEDRKNGTVNGRIAEFVQDICELVRKEHQDFLIGHYSYSNFKDFIFVKEKVPDNLLISFTQFRCLGHSVNDAACEGNLLSYERLRKTKAAVSNVYIYDYYTHNWGYLPAPIWRVVTNDFKAYYENGVSGFLSEVSSCDHDSWKSFHLALYVTAKYLFDVNSNLENILDDYCRVRYGAASAPMRKYLDILEKSLSNMKGCFNKVPENFEEIFSPEVRGKCSVLLSDAERKADNPSCKKFIKKEEELFERWCETADKRKKIKAPSKIKTLPLNMMNSLNSLQDSSPLFFVDKISLLPDENETYCMIFSDADNIGFIFDCYEKNMEKINSSGAGAKGNMEKVYASENIEIFLSSSRDASKCYHFLISSGAVVAAAESSGTKWNWAWQHNAAVEVKTLPDRWRLYFTLPKKDIEADGRFYFTLARNRHIDKWKISGVPDGCVFFNTSKYIEASE